MDPSWRTIIWQQFGAAIDMLDNALRACPDQLWLDFCLSGSLEEFVPPVPFTLDELNPAGLLPERPYTKDELETYLDHGREKCRATIQALTDEEARQRCGFSWGEVSFSELLVYNMRHVQDHAAELNLILGQKIGYVPGWVTRAKSRRTRVEIPLDKSE